MQCSEVFRDELFSLLAKHLSAKSLRDQVVHIDRLTQA